MEVPQAILDRFTSEAKSRGEDPDDALEQLMIDYIAGRDHDALLEEVHDYVVKDEAATATDGGQTATDTSAQSTTRPTNSISDYDPEDDARLTRTAMEMLPDVDEPVEVDPDDVPKGAIPGAVPSKQALIEAVVRYEYDAVTRDDVAAVADDFVDAGTPGYFENNYVDGVLDRFDVYVDGEQLERTFVSVEAAMDWMDDRIAEEGAYAEEDVRDVIVELYSMGVDVDELQPYADECNLGPIESFA